MSAFFSRSKESNGTGGISELDNILGHIDELINQRIPILFSSKNDKARANVVSIEQKEKRIKISSLEELGAPKGSLVTIGFPLDGTWLEFESPFFKENHGMFVSYPSSLEARERRSDLRSTFSSREDVSAALLESFGKGVGITGSVDNISSAAFSLSVLRAMDLSSEREIRFHENLLKTGQEFMLCRLKGIPGVPQIECGGRMARVARKGKWQLVMTFTNLSGDLRNALNQFTMSRTMPYQTVTRSYKRKMELREEMSKQNEQENPIPAERVPLQNDPVIQTAQPHFSPTPPASSAGETHNPQNADSEPTERIELPIKLVRRLQDGPPILTLGESINKDLSFLYSLGNHWKPCPTVKELVRTLQNLKNAILVIPKSMNGQPVLDYMDKLAATGAMEHISLFMLAETGLSPEEVALCKRVRVRRVFPFPLAELEPFLSAVLAVQVTA